MHFRREYLFKTVQMDCVVCRRTLSKSRIRSLLHADGLGQRQKYGRYKEGVICLKANAPPAI